MAHAAGQVAMNAGVGPRLFSVAIAETTNVISTECVSGMTTAA